MVMDRKCVANNCNSREQKIGEQVVALDASGEPVTFHKFPPLMVKEWCDQLKLQPGSLKPDFVVCSNHFSDKMFVDTGNNDAQCRTRLKKIAFPNINLPVVSGLKRLAIVKRIDRTDETTIKILESMKQLPCLWNPSIPDYHDEERRIAAIQLVADDTKCEEDLLMDRIDEIRVIFIQQLAALEEQPENPIQINWFQEAQFLWDGITSEEISQSEVLPPIEKRPRLEDKLVKCVEIKKMQTYPKRCRMCLKVEKAKGKPFEKLQSGDMLVDMFRKLTNFRVIFDQGDHLPHHICENCRHSLLSSQNFIDRCHRTEEILQTVYQCVDSNSAQQLLADLNNSDIDIKVEIEDLPTEEENVEEELIDGKWEGWENETSRCEEMDDWVDEPKTKPKRNQRKKPSKKPVPDHEWQPKTKSRPIVAKSKVKVETPPKLEATKRLCPFCGLLPRTNKSNEEHIKRCALNPDRIQDLYQCAHCTHQYTSKTALLDHLRSKHFNIVIEHKCQYCDNVYTSSSAVYAHIRKNHRKDKAHACTLCDKKYAFKFRLDNHIRSIHTKETPFNCHLCDAQRSTRNQLKRHLDTVHSTQPVYCTLCGKPFKHQRYLKIHSAIHTGEKHYKCPVCTMRFSESRHMRSHCARHHPGHELPPKGTVIKEDYLPVWKAIQEKQDSFIKF